MKTPAEAGVRKSAAITYSRLTTTIGRAGLTTVFGMVTGVTLHVLSPQGEIISTDSMLSTPKSAGRVKIRNHLRDK